MSAVDNPLHRLLVEFFDLPTNTRSEDISQQLLAKWDSLAMDTVAPWLRKSYAVLFLAYAVAVLTLARRYLAPGFAVTATALCLLQVQTLFLSDLLFAELPFALVSVLLVLVAANEQSPLRGWLREAASFLLAAAGFLLRTAGLALLAAWVLEAIVRRRWRLAVVRGALALLPMIAWQTYVARVRASDEYAHPAYEYQRASYQYYNVSYADNVRLLDPFRPELGRMGLTTFAARLATNLPSLLESLGESISTVDKDWRLLFDKIQRHLVGRHGNERLLQGWISSTTHLLRVFGTLSAPGLWLGPQTLIAALRTVCRRNHRAFFL